MMGREGVCGLAAWALCGDLASQKRNAKVSLMDFTLSKHAMDVMQARGIEHAWVAATIANPGATEPHRDDPAVTHAFRRIPEFGNRVLKVAYNKSKNPPHVVTVYFDRTAKGKV